MMKITVEGELISLAHDLDAHFTYIITISEAPVTKPDVYMRMVIELVKFASVQGEFLIERHQRANAIGWEPYIDAIEQLSSTQWKVRIIYPYTDS